MGAAFALAVVGVVVDACVVEPRWLEVTHHVITLPVKAPLTIAHVSDVHARGRAVERALIDALAHEKPDVIVITGDLYDRASASELATALVDEMRAPLGVWFAPGNWEHWTEREKGAPFLAAKSARVLVNEAAALRDDLWLIGVDDAFAGAPDFARAQAAVPNGVARIALFHSPAFFARLRDGDVDLALAGHTHGGQVRVPLLGAPYVPPESRPYVDGWYENGRARMYVSRGVGTSIVPVRFACRPELAILRVEPSSP